MKKTESAILTFDSESPSAPDLFDMGIKTNGRVLTYTLRITCGEPKSKLHTFFDLWGTFQK